MTRTRLLGALLALCLATPARAQLNPGRTMQPDEVLTFTCDGSQQWGDTVPVVASFTHTLTKRGGSDATCLPTAAIATQLAPTGIFAPVRIAPVNRHGCDFQLHITATLTNGQVIDCDQLIHVRSTVLP